MAKKAISFIESEKADEFAATLEEATRSTIEGVKYFIEPAKGTLSRAKTRRHHLIFGRRGSGKSSLLNKLLSELSLERTPVSYIDLEAFKGHTYPDVLVSILIKTLDSYHLWFQNAGIHPASRQSFWIRLFGSKPKVKSIDKKLVDPLLKKISEIRSELEDLLHEPEELERVRVARHGTDAKLSGGLKAAASSSSLSVSASSEKRDERETTDAYGSRKIETLHRKILLFRKLFEDISDISGRSSYLLLDDLYHIRPDH